MTRLDSPGSRDLEYSKLLLPTDKSCNEKLKIEFMVVNGGGGDEMLTAREAPA